MCDHHKTFRLYVVGESSGDPDTWSMYGGWALVIASSPEDALVLTDCHGPATPVEFIRSSLLAWHPPADLL